MYFCDVICTFLSHDVRILSLQTISLNRIGAGDYCHEIINIFKKNLLLCHIFCIYCLFFLRYGNVRKFPLIKKKNRIIGDFLYCEVIFV